MIKTLNYGLFGNFMDEIKDEKKIEENWFF